MSIKYHSTVSLYLSAIQSGVSEDPVDVAVEVAVVGVIAGFRLPKIDFDQPIQKTLRS